MLMSYWGGQKPETIIHQSFFKVIRFFTAGMLQNFVLNKFEKIRVGELLCGPGKTLLCFYVIHWLIIGNVATAIYQTQTLSSFPSGSAGIFVICILITRCRRKSN